MGLLVVVVGGQPFYFQLHLLCAEVQHVLLGGFSVYPCAPLPRHSACKHRAGLCGRPEWGDGGLRRLSHGYNFSLVEQWLELTAVPVTRPPSFLWCIVLCAEWGFTYGKKTLLAFQKCCWRAVAIFCTVQCNLISSCFCCFYVVKQRRRRKKKSILLPENCCVVISL